MAENARPATGTGVVVTQTCPGPVDSEFDQLAGSAGGMSDGPPQFLRISAAQCARETLAGFDRGVPLALPRAGLPDRDARIPAPAPPVVAPPGRPICHTAPLPATLIPASCALSYLLQRYGR